MRILLLVFALLGCSRSAELSTMPQGETLSERSCRRSRETGPYRYVIGVESGRGVPSAAARGSLITMESFELDASETRAFPNIGGTAWNCVGLADVHTNGPPAVGLRCEHDGSRFSLVVSCVADTQNRGAFIRTSGGAGRYVSAQCYRRNTPSPDSI